MNKTAHCYGALHVLINGHSLSTPSSNSESFNVITEVAHPEFRTWKYTNDILLLKLDANSSAPVVRINQNPTSPADNEIVRVIGWGASSADGVAANISSVSDVLQVVDVIYVNNDVCEVALQRQISDDMCCTIDAGQGSCQGDSGGPLIIPGDNASDDNQVGIVSWGTGMAMKHVLVNAVVNAISQPLYLSLLYFTGCAETNFPGVYSRISHNYEHFIRSFTCILSTNPPDWFDCENATTYSPAPSPGPQLPSATSSENDTSSTPLVEATNGVVELSDASVPDSTESPQSPFTPSPPTSILSNGAPIISPASPFVSSTAKHDYLVTTSLLFFGLINHI
jgi:secreted trypsin-like serine protease